MQEILKLLPRRIADGVSEFSNDELEEIRLRLGQAPTVCIRGEELPVPNTSEVTEADLYHVVASACGGSFYSAEEQLRRGYFTVKGGHRIGVSGRAICSDGSFYAIAPTSLNVRVARDIKGAAPTLYKSTLIAGPPGCGKTTLLRDCIRKLSNTGLRVSVADERLELSGNGAFDLGAHTDVMSGCAKADAVERLLRVMRPDWIAVDEITREADADALIRGAYCGAKLLATCHIASYVDLLQRPIYKRILDAAVFSELILMQSDHSRKTVRAEALR